MKSCDAESTDKPNHSDGLSRRQARLFVSKFFCPARVVTSIKATLREINGMLIAWVAERGLREETGRRCCATKRSICVLICTREYDLSTFWLCRFIGQMTDEIQHL